MNKLSDNQRRILKAASKQPETDVRVHMQDLNSHIRDKVVTSMLKQGLIIEDPDAEGIVYVISDAGFAAIGKTKPKSSAEDSNAGEQQHAVAVVIDETPAKTPAPKAKREGKSKKQIMIDMLSQEDGVTHKQLMDATGWQKHSVHGGMANLNKQLIATQGLTIASSKTEGEERIYRIIKHEPAREAELAE